MSVIYVDLVLAVWLLVSAFVLGHTPLSAIITAIVAVAVGALVWVSLKKAVMRYVSGALTLVLVVLAVLLPSLSVAARINTAIVSVVLLALSVASLVHRHPHGHPQAVGPGGTHPPSPD